MKRFLLTLILMFSFQCFVNADDIRDFQIEGMSIGDSLLDHISRSEIKPIKSPNTKLKIVRAYIDKNLKKYDFVQAFYFDDDLEFKIVGLSGELRFNNDLEGCKIQQNKIVKSLKELFPSIKNQEFENHYHGDNTKKSKVYHNQFLFSNKDNFNVQCYFFSKNFKKKNNFIDNLKVMIVTKEMDDHYKNAWK